MGGVVAALIVVSLTGCATTSAAPVYVVAVPVADLRAQPSPPAATTAHDPLQETQVLYGERIQLIRTQAAWAFVEAIEQPEYTHHQTWQGYPGWILQDQLQPVRDDSPPNAVVTAKWATLWHSLGGAEPSFRLPLGTELVIRDTQGEHWGVRLVDGLPAWIPRTQVRRLAELEALPPADRRALVVQTADTLLGDPYFWGGRSPASDTPGSVIMGVDCSGLVNLAYRAAGLHIPRDAHEQYLRAHKVNQLQPADLVFLSAPHDPHTIVHVMLYAGDGWLIEGPGTGGVVRRISVVERLEQLLSQVDPGEEVHDQTIYFGSYLP